MSGGTKRFSAAIFVGYHAGTTNPAGVRAHTMSSANLADVRLNGVSVPEAGLNAAIAGSFESPPSSSRATTSPAKRRPL